MLEYNDLYRSYSKMLAKYFQELELFWNFISESGLRVRFESLKLRPPINFEKLSSVDLNEIHS